MIDNQVSRCSGSREEAAPAARARQLLDRATRVFPVTISATTIFNMPQVAILASHWSMWSYLLLISLNTVL